ncbi:MAG: alpha/beta fold hydrolase [Eggerthellaceae bacterium]|jgi:2-succinyl-6-hydroxy-2,4-cyclohexadiene-1-carboxylate synthase
MEESIDTAGRTGGCAGGPDDACGHGCEHGQPAGGAARPDGPAFVEQGFEHDGVRYHVRRWGDPADIPLLALHGFMQTGATWEPLAADLACGHCVYAIDLVGHGQSDKPYEPMPYTIDAMVEMLAAFIKEAILPENASAVPTGQRAQNHVHVLGYSMGGRIALELAVQHPELVYTLVLESAGLGPADETERAAYAQRAAAWARDLRAQGTQAFVDCWEQLPLFASQQRLPEDTRARVRNERLANDAEALALTLENSGQDRMRLRDEYLEQLSYSWIPVYYLSGTRDDKYLELAELLIHEGFEAKALMGGHNLHLEVPDYYREALDGFYRANEMRGI